MEKLWRSEHQDKGSSKTRAPLVNPNSTIKYQQETSAFTRVGENFKKLQNVRRPKIIIKLKKDQVP